MLLGVVLAGVIAAQPASAAPLSPETQALIAPVAAAIAKVKGEQAALPPPKDDAEKLVRMGDLEQAPREEWVRVDFSKIPIAERDGALRAIGEAIGAVDHANQQTLLAMLPPEGWFTISRYGKPAANAAFPIIQHAGDELQRRFLPVLEPLVAQGEIEGRAYALMYDRVAIGEGRLQRYGSQVKCEGGHWVAFPIEDPAGVDARRASMGLSPYAENLKRLTSSPACH